MIDLLRAQFESAEMEPELRAFVAQALNARTGRSSSRAKLNRKAAEIRDQRIQDAAGALPFDDPTTPGILQKRIRRMGARAFGLSCVPSLRRIRRALRKKGGPELGEQPTRGSVAASRPRGR